MDMKSSNWWDNHVNVCTWSMLGRGEHDESILHFFRDMEVSIADRGHFVGMETQNPEKAKAIAKLHHENGIKITSFNTIEGWNAEEANLMIEQLKHHIDLGYDGVHLDMFNATKDRDSITTWEAGQKISTALKKYAKDRYNKDIMFSGNTWVNENPLSIKLTSICDVAWVESWGDSIMDVALICKIGKATRQCPRSCWYHLQPNTDEEWKITDKSNYVRALMSSCIMEGAVFLCNLSYPVLSTKDDRWHFVAINEAWKKYVLQYGAFLNRYKEYHVGTQPQAEAVYVVHPREIALARPTMFYLMNENIQFNLLISGDKPLGELDTDTLSAYKYILTNKRAGFSIPSQSTNIHFDQGMLRETLQSLADYSRSYLSFSDDRVVGRIMKKDTTTIVHVKNRSYCLDTDSISSIYNVQTNMYAPGAYKVVLISPDTNEEDELDFTVDRENIHFQLPVVEYYSTIIVHAENNHEGR